MLEKVNKPEDLKKLNNDELKELAKEIRSFLVEKVSASGGHLSSNLGVVELTIALFLEFDPYYDRIIWDVGHQAYVHKILTNRAEEFDSLRKFNGLSGFPKAAESESDAFNSGHSSNSISAAAGYAAAARLDGTDKRAIAVIGDGAMTGGMAFEALNHIGSLKLPVIVVLNDNGMSISKNVGALSRRLKRIRSTARYFQLKSNVKSTLGELKVVGRVISKVLKAVKQATKKIVMPNVFEDFGFKYLGPIDGNDLERVRLVLKEAKNMDEPVVVHIHTKKGKGYTPAEKNPDLFHGISCFDLKTGETKPNKGKTWSDCFGEYLCEIADKNEKVTAITAAMPLGTGLSEFSKGFSNRFFDVAIAEQHAVTFAAGLAKSGYVPIVAIYSTFLQRAFDQIIHDVSLMNLHIVFCIDRCGIVGEDGETHQGVFDISYMSQVPNCVILSPSDKEDLKYMLNIAVNELNCPVAVRYPRGVAKERAGATEKNGLKACLVKEGRDVLISAVGITVYDALKAAKILEEKGISVAVSDVRCIKPIDRDFFEKEAENKKVIVSVEDGVEIGGFGQQLENVLDRKVLKFAYPNEPIVQGSIDELKVKYNMSAEAIAEKIIAEINYGKTKA